jgi:hypothetical protein
MNCADESIAVRAIQFPLNYRLYAASDPIKTALREKVGDKRTSVAIAAARTLISLGDLAEIYNAENQSRIWKGTSALRLAGAIGGLRDPQAVPAIVKFAQMPGEGFRKAVIYALREIRSDSAVAALAAALNDPDEDVRYHAIMGLAFQTGRMNPDWAWGYAHFKENPEALTSKWKQWWETEGKTKYPSIDEVLKDYEREKNLYPIVEVVAPAAPKPAAAQPTPAPVRNTPKIVDNAGWLSRNRYFVIIAGLCVVVAVVLGFSATRFRRNGK